MILPFEMCKYRWIPSVWMTRAFIMRRLDILQCLLFGDTHFVLLQLHGDGSIRSMLSHCLRVDHASIEQGQGASLLCCFSCGFQALLCGVLAYSDTVAVADVHCYLVLTSLGRGDYVFGSANAAIMTHTTESVGMCVFAPELVVLLQNPF